jgi:hypothetical protein
MSKTSPDHYQQGSIETWDYIVDQQLGYLEGNIVKYISRAGKKEGERKLDDLLKAQAYIHKAVITEINATSRSTGTSDPVQNSDVSTDCYHEWYSSHDAALFDR